MSFTKHSSGIIIIRNRSKNLIGFNISEFLFQIRWGKERPDNSRLLIQDVGLPDLDFSPLEGRSSEGLWNVQAKKH